jgi:hypothetical protein
MSNIGGGPHTYKSLPTGEFDEDDEEGGRGFNGRMSLDRKMKQQDASLDVLGNSVARLGEMSLNISKEIDLQNRMLSSLEVEMDGAHEKADTLNKRTAELIKRGGGPKTCGVIACLVIVLIILILLVIYS